LPSFKESIVLDIEFGFGQFMIYLKQKGYQNITGAEYSAGQVNNMRNKGFAVHQIDDLMAFLAKHEEKFDLVHLSNVAEYIPKYDLIDTFDVIHRSLKMN